MKLLWGFNRRVVDQPSHLVHHYLYRFIDLLGRFNRFVVDQPSHYLIQTDRQNTFYVRIFLFYSILFCPITLEGRRGSTDEFATIPFHLDLFSAALVELAKSIPGHSLILSSHLFFCLPLFLFPFTGPCRTVFAKPENLETWPNHLSSRFLTRVRSSSYSPMAAWIFLRTSSLVTWSLYEMFNSLR